ncbi:MAG: hypothetical protein KJ007_05540, partial [Burkholderiales bacterium]|nr:hypothetical protein [Burkholderiales bacterium]
MPEAGEDLEGGRRWRAVAALGVTQIVSWGSLYYGFAVVMWAVAAYLAGVGVVGMAALVAAGAHFAWQLATLDISDPQNCLVRF